LFQTFTQKHQAHFIEKKSDLQHWRDFYEKPAVLPKATEQSSASLTLHKELQPVENIMQLHLSYVLVQNEEGFLLVQQQNAHERILYERYQEAMGGKPMATQQSLFPSTIELTPSDAVLLQELLPDLKVLGYQLEPFGNNTYVIHGTPADIVQGNEKVILEKMLEQYKHFSNDIKFSSREKLLRSLAWQQAVKSGTTLTKKEMQSLIQDLFACKIPNTTPNGKPTYTVFKKDELDKMFGR
jgi:DNA mismatch repair protein MutL